MSNLAPLKTPLIKLIWAFMLRATLSGNWNLYSLNINLQYIYIYISHLKVISQELCKLNICIHFPTCVFFFLESDLPSRLYRDTPSALLPPSKKKKPGALATKQFPLPPYPAGPSFINLSTESRSSRRGDKIYIRKALRSFCSGRTEQILKMFLIAFLKKDCVSENMFL